MRRGLLLILLAAVTWGTTGTTFKLMGTASGSAPLLVGWSRMVISAPLLALGAVLLEGGVRVRGRAFLVAGACIAGYQAADFTAIPWAGVAATAVLAICTAPLMIAVMEWAFLRERLGARTAISMALGVGGTALLVGGASISAGPRFLAGCALALTAAVLYAVFAVITRRSLAGTPPLGLAAASFGTAAVLMAPVLLFHPDFSGVVGAHWPSLLYLGAVPTALAYALYNTGLRRVTATAASIMALMEPLTATLLGLLLFRERLGAAGLAGAAVLIGAVALLGTESREPVAVEA